MTDYALEPTEVTRTYLVFQDKYDPEYFVQEPEGGFAKVAIVGGIPVCKACGTKCAHARAVKQILQDQR